MKAKETQPVKKKGKGKAILIALGATAVAVGGWFGWNYFSKKKDTGEEDADVDTSSASTYVAPSSGGSYTPKVIADSFPLKKGSKGENVKKLQLALIAKYGSSILPRYGADGDFGSEVEAALTKIGLPTTVDESAFNVLMKSGSPDASATATKIGKALLAKDFNATIAGLKLIRNVSDYIVVNTEFKKFTPYPLEPVPLVRAAIGTFAEADKKDQMRLQFLRIGLKFDGKAWSLSGLEGQLIITVKPTEVIDFKHKVKVQVPTEMVLGYFLQEKQGYTLFKSMEANKKLVVKSNTVKFYERH